MPAVMRHTNIPVEINAFTDVCLKMFMKFASVKKLDVAKLKITHNTNRAIRDPSLLTRPELDFNFTLFI
ncbi:MAG: hypothetical protein RHS_4910 [Robinsoniella sp. RHS]|nr:MAG: hypothetical protein RHS_4910 [Robinsoniella sp. RHS]